MSRNGGYKLEKIEEILGVDSLERSLDYVEYELRKMGNKLRKTEAELKEAEAKIEALESYGEGKYGRYIDSSKGAVRMFVNVENDSSRVSGNLPSIKN